MLINWMPVSESNTRYINFRIGFLWDIKNDSSVNLLETKDTKPQLDKLKEKAVREFQLNGHKTLTTFF